MAASNAEPLLKFILQTICIQQLQEMRRNVRHAALSKWNILVRIAGLLTTYIGAVDIRFPIGMLSGN